MNFNDYQKQAITTDTFGGVGNIADPAFITKILGLVGEAGEVAEKFKKVLRDKEANLSDSDKAEVVKELGDVLWYISSITHYLGVPLQQVADVNLEKVHSRKSRGVTHGSGDNR
jgi:NTP pyrophosphatase (non-canonical NTP hydrolase)